MKDIQAKIQHNLGVLNFAPLIDHLRQRVKNICEVQINFLNEIVKQHPDLMAPITDLEKLENYKPQIQQLFRLVFPTIFWESEKISIMLPASIIPIHVSPGFKSTFLNDKGQLSFPANFNQNEFLRKRISKMYMYILEHLYHQKTGVVQDDHIIMPNIDKQTGLERFYHMKVDMRFVNIISKGTPKKLDNDTLKQIKKNISYPERIQSILPIDDFTISGITIIRATEVTQAHVLSLIQQDLIDQDNVITQKGFFRLQQRLRNYFKSPNLVASLSSLYDDQILLLNTGCDLTHSCIFSNSRHLDKSYFKDTPFEKAVLNKEILAFGDIIKDESLNISKKTMDGANIRSLLICPLIYKDECIGTLDLAAPEPDIFGAQEIIKVEAIRPLFAMAINRAIEDLDNEVQGIIKKQCTAVHPSVEWRFRQATLKYINEMQAGEQTELAPIVFKNVFPLYAIADVRGSTKARNHAIQKDLEAHLSCAREVIDAAANEKPMLILNQLSDRIQEQLERIQSGLASGDELSIVKFVRSDIEDVFPHIRHFSPKVSEAIDLYMSKVDQNVGTVYQLRKEFEESIQLLNQRLTTFLDIEEGRIQSIFPHYFERHRTDGVDYLMYIGKSMHEKGEFHEIYLKNLHLWQLQVACGMAWLTQHLKPELSVTLDTAHLILVQTSPLSIRFRYDEKKFDVDGAYDIRHEIIKSRIDKAVVKGTRERLTQPQKIAIVYSQQEEQRSMMRHITYLQKKDFIKKHIEFLDLEDLPGVTGLKALRVGVIMNSSPLGNWMAQYFKP
ncbi:cell surface protein [Candidatus Magnetomorum sp. HK-1]|nr:cell surface protein [Candidatus Magnetomorum sp. HK-1]